MAKVNDDDEWNKMVMEALRRSPPTRIPTNAYYDPRLRSALYSDAELNNPDTRREIHALNPDTRFDVASMNDDNISDYWYIGVPNKSYHRYWFHLVRNRSASHFDKVGSFAANLKSSNTFNAPPHLLLLLADKFRKAEYVRLRGEAVQSAQRQYGRFETMADLEPEMEEAEAILKESLSAFLTRMQGTFLAFMAITKLEF